MTSTWHNARSTRYPKSLSLQVSTDVDAIICDAAERQGLTKADVMRAFLHRGMRAAGYRPEVRDEVGRAVEAEVDRLVEHPEP